MIKKFNDFNKLNETRNTPQDILNIFQDRIKSYDLDEQFKVSIERTQSSYKVIIIDKNVNKTVGRIYIQDIRNKGNEKYSAEMRRLYINPDYRGLKLGDKLLSIAIETFGDLELYGYASPNRNPDMKEDEKEKYRKRLFNFYKRHGLERVSDKNFKVVRPVNEKIKLKHTDGDPLYFNDKKIDDGTPHIKIYNDDTEIGYMYPKYKGNIPIDPKNSFTKEEIEENGYKINNVFPNSVLLDGGFKIDDKFRNKGYARESIKQYFLDNPDVENLFLYAIPWQGAVEFWHKIGGKSILKVDTERKSIHYIQLNRNDILKNKN